MLATPLPPPKSDDIDPRRRALVAAALLGGSALACPRLVRAERLFDGTESTPIALEDDSAAASLQPIDWEWVDTTRQRKVPVRLFWPQRSEAQAAAPVPLVVFSHGIGGSRMGYSYLGRHFASRGWACLHVQHVGSDRALWFGNPITLISRLRTAAQESEAIHRVRDIRFALDSLLDPALQHPQLGRPAEQIDAQRIVAAGHSYGANTTLLAVGARVARDKQVFDFQDARFRAAILLSSPPFYGERDLGSILAPVKLPTLHITSTEDVILIPGYRSGLDDRLAVFDAMPDARKALVVFDRGSHNIFTDRIVAGGYEMNQQVKGATKALAGAFLRQQFAGDTAALPAWQQHWRSIVARSNGLVSVPVNGGPPAANAPVAPAVIQAPT